MTLCSTGLEILFLERGLLLSGGHIDVSMELKVMTAPDHYVSEHFMSLNQEAKKSYCAY